jgi:Mor family transcriptional regulator
VKVKLNSAQVRAIRSSFRDGRTHDRAPGCSRAELARTYGVSIRWISILIKKKKRRATAS